MNEKELRQYFADTCVSYLGCNEADGSHKTIVNMYNSIQPLPVNYRLSYNDAWCAAFVSAMAWKCKLTDIIFPECGCDRMIKLYQAAGRWQENDGYVPDIGDIIFYDWGDSGSGQNTGSSDHVGVIVSVSGLTMKVIEGNISDSVGYRNIIVDGRYIRGFGLPDFASLASAEDINVLGKEETVIIPSADVPETNVGNTGGECEVKLPVLKRGSKGNSVKAAQYLLIANGCSVGPDGADGDFGNNTCLAVLKYQGKKGLTKDGIAGPATWSAMLK